MCMNRAIYRGDAEYGMTFVYVQATLCVCVMQVGVMGVVVGCGAGMSARSLPTPVPCTTTCAPLTGHQERCMWFTTETRMYHDSI